MGASFLFSPLLPHLFSPLFSSLLFTFCSTFPSLLICIVPGRNLRLSLFGGDWEHQKQLESHLQNKEAKSLLGGGRRQERRDRACGKMVPRNTVHFPFPVACWVLAPYSNSVISETSPAQMSKPTIPTKRYIRRSNVPRSHS